MRLALLSGFCAGALLIAGCSSQSAREAAESVAREAFQREAGQARKDLAQLGDVSSRGATLVGQDEQSRNLWSIGFKTGHLREEKTDASGKVITPRSGDLRDARATLYRAGVPSTSFRAAHLVFTDTPRGIMITMTESVQARSSDLWANSNQFGSGGADSKVKAKAAKSGVSKIAKPQAKPKMAAREPVLMQAPRMDVDVSAHRLTAPDGVEMTQGQTRINGKQLDADSELAVARLQGDVRARDPQGTLSSDAAVWNWRAGRALATGRVSLAHEGTTLTGARLDADTRLSRGTLSGAPSAPSTSGSTNANAAALNGVRVVSTNGEARASQLLYNWKTGAISARGGVSLQKDGGTLTAARIDSDDKLRVATAQSSVTLRKDDATLTASRITAYDGLSRAVASGGVLLTRPGERLKAGSATVWIGQKRAEARDGVTFARPDITVRAARAQVTDASSRATAQLTASGNVTLVRPDMTVRAQNAHVTDMTSRATARLTASGDVRLSRADLFVNASRVETVPQGDKQVVTATGGVSARNKSGAVRANQVVWHEGATQQNGRVVATGDVALRKGGGVLRGQRLESDTGFHLATLSGAVGGDLKQTDGAAMVVSARQMQVTDFQNAKSARLVATGDVSARRDNLSLRGDRLQATGDGAHAILTGNVVVKSDDGSTVRAPYARYEKAENKIYASGGVVMIDPKRGTQRGRTLVADLNLKKAVLTDVTGTPNQNLFKNKLFGD